MLRTLCMAMLLLGIALDDSVCSAAPRVSGDHSLKTERPTNRLANQINLAIVATTVVTVFVPMFVSHSRAKHGPRPSTRQKSTQPRVEEAWAEWSRLDALVLARSLEGLTYPPIVGTHLENAKDDLRRGEVGAAIYSMRLAARRAGW